MAAHALNPSELKRAALGRGALGRGALGRGDGGAPSGSLARATGSADGLASRALSMDGRAGASANEREARRQVDAGLVQRSLKGDDEAFGALVERYQRQVYWVAHDVLLDAEEARDVAQETFLRVHGALASFDPSRDFVNWIYRIARNLAIDAHRRRKRRATPMEDLTQVPQASSSTEIDGVELSGAEAAGERQELRARVTEVLAELPVEYRLALTLRELHGLTPLEIARVTDCTYPTARWRLHRARLLFRKRWTERFGETPTTGASA